MRPPRSPNWAGGSRAERLHLSRPECPADEGQNVALIPVRTMLGSAHLYFTALAVIAMEIRVRSRKALASRRGLRSERSPSDSESGAGPGGRLRERRSRARAPASA